MQTLQDMMMDANMEVSLSFLNSATQKNTKTAHLGILKPFGAAMCGQLPDRWVGDGWLVIAGIPANDTR